MLWVFIFFPQTVWPSIWNQPTQCFHSFGGLLDSIGYQLTVKLWFNILLCFTGLFLSPSLSLVLYLTRVLVQLVHTYVIVFVCNLLSFLENLQLFCLITFWQILLALQVMHSLPGFWCFLCRFLHCTSMHHWYSCLLLSSMYHCTPVCSCRPGTSWCHYWFLFELVWMYESSTSSVHVLKFPSTYQYLSTESLKKISDIYGSKCLSFWIYWS